VLSALGARPDPLTGAIVAPSESTLRRALAGVDAAELQRLTATWVAATVRATRVRDGDGGTRPHLLGAATHDGAIILAQRQIPDKGSEITELAPLVTELDLNGKVVTA
jgi:hypothetical protein